MSFTIIPDWLSEEKELGLNEKLVYAILLRFQGKNDQAWPSRETVAKRAMLSVRSTERSIAKLLTLNWIEKTRYGRGKTNRYRCLRVSPANLASHPIITRPVGDSEPANLASLNALSPAQLATLSSGSGEKENTSSSYEGGEEEVFLEKTEPTLADRLKTILQEDEEYVWRYGVDDKAIAGIAQLTQVTREDVNEMLDEVWVAYKAKKIDSIPGILLYRLKAKYDPR